MTTKSTKRKYSPPSWTLLRPRLDFRFASHEHYDMVKEAAIYAGLSINAWLVNVSLAAARQHKKKMEG